MGETSVDDSYVCPCGRQFKRKAPYERHLDIAHSNAESHKCHTCRKTFGNANTLKMHMNIHVKGDTKIERLTRGGRKHPTTVAAAKRLKSPQGKRPQLKIDVQAMERVELNEERHKLTTELEGIVVVKAEPQSPLVSDSFEESPTPTVSPSAKENVLPPAKTHTSVVRTLQDSTTKVSIVVDKDKVHLIDSTNTSHLPLQSTKSTSETLLIKLEDPGHYQSPHVSNLTLLGQESSQDCMVSVQQIGHAATAPSFAPIPETVASQTADDCIDIKFPTGVIIQDLDDDSNVRKSSRLKGKTPGWRTWLETDEVAIPGIKTFQQRRNRKSKVKLEGEDYDIIQQVVDMTSGGVFPEIESPELPTTLGSPAEPNMQPSLNNKRCREIAKTVIPCPVCNKEFYSEKYLSMHMSLHRGSQADLLQTSVIEDDEPSMKKTKVSVNGNGAHWTCKICNKTFAQNSNFKNHIRTHSDERPFVCEICCIGFKERYHLKKHMLFKHSNELKEECRVCGKKFKDSTAVRAHERIHSDVRPYACRRCGKTFKTSECLWHHENRSKTCGVALDGVQAPSSRFRRGRQARKNSFSIPMKTEIPDVVQQSLTTSTPLVSAAQVQALHSINSIPTTVQALEMMTKPNLQTRNNMVTTAMRNSPIVLPSINNSPVLNPHLQLVKVEQDIELPDYDLTALGSDGSLDDSSQDADLNELFPSDEETDEIDSPMSLDNNSSPLDLDDTTSSSSEYAQSCEALEVRCDPQGKKRFLCTKCGKQFASFTAFDKHMVTHSELRPYKCQVCDIGFKLKVHLKKHNLYRHSSEYPCECSICGKKFKDSSAVRLHERIHSNDRPFKCVCGKSFKTRENLWGHRHRGPCEKNKDAQGQNNAQSGDPNVGAYASILDNEIIAHAFVSNNKVTAKAFIGNNGEVTASALVQGSKVSAQASVNGNNGQAQAKVGSQVAVVRSQPQVMTKAPSIPQTVMDMQSRDETSRATSFLTSMNSSQHSSLPTAVVAPIKKVVPQPQVSSPPAKGVQDDKGLPPFETFAPTIMSALQKPPTLPPGVQMPHHLVNQKPIPTPMAIEKSLLPSPITSCSIAERCPTIQRYLQQNRPTTTRLPGIQQLFQSHSMAHKNNRMYRGVGTSPITLLRVPPPGTPPTSGSQGLPSPFSPDLHLPPPPPYPGNPNLGGPANADFRSKTPSSFTSGQSPAPLPLICWDDDSSCDKKAAGPWATDADSLFHELANSPTFSHI